ncbi:sugar phosphate isomerase/epimerase [Candidatus Gracilibacteria bacterium]|nr:sugar phosphate isomerase/epimerase [Candidatus Gracilibacteria bacterium]
MTAITISNLAWEKYEDTAVFKLIQDAHIHSLEISIFRDSNDFSSTEKIIKQLAPYGIKVVALQSLLFRHSELYLFQQKKSREQMLDHLLKVISFAHRTGVKNIIFGCPKNKIRGDMAYQEAFQIAVNFFSRLAQHCESLNIIFCIEPTPSIYGADFICNTEEAVKLVRACDNKFLRVNFDLGASITNKENIKDTILKNAEHIGHFHISEPFLKAIRLNSLFHKGISKIIRHSAYKGPISIEMLPKETNNIESIKRTLSFVQEIYT